MSADNQIDYVEFQAADLVATRTFLEQLFEWKFTDYGPDYTSFEDGRIAGGFSRGAKRSTIEAGGVLVVFYHPRLEEVRQRVIDLGGRVTADIFSFPGGRRFHFAEPSGNECAIWSEESRAQRKRRARRVEAVGAAFAADCAVPERYRTRGRAIWFAGRVSSNRALRS